MDLSGLTIFVKYGAEILFGKISRKTMEILKTADKAGDETYKISLCKVLSSSHACVELNMQVLHLLLLAFLLSFFLSCCSIVVTI